MTGRGADRLGRRRFLAISAAFAACPRGASAETWRGYALGADVSVTLTGPPEHTAAALQAVPARLRQVETLFSLYDPASALSRLNHAGQLAPPPLFARLLRLCTRAHVVTGGLFDPTVQTLWQAYAAGTGIGAARARLGWHRVRLRDGRISLAPGQQLTFNGIAQGFATDLVRSDLAARGFARDALVNIGELAALGGPFRIGIGDPVHGIVGYRSLTGRALATSSPGATRIGSAPHLMAPDGRAPLWSSVTVEAASAALADALSTAAVFLPEQDMQALAARMNVQFLTVDPGGDVRTLG